MFDQDPKSIKALMSSLKENLLCTYEGPSDSYLGIEIKDSEECLTLRQPQLIIRIT